MQFYFIRHGQSANNLLWEQTGSAKGRSDDPGLTATGRRQAEALGQYLSGTAPLDDADHFDSQNVNGFGITHLYTSLMVRSVETATIIARSLELPIIAWEDLHEGGGIYLEDEETGERVGQAGKNRAYFEAHYPDLILPESLGAAGWWNRPFEAHEQRQERARRFLSEMLARHGDMEDRVAVVSHAAFYNYLLAQLLALPQRDGYWFVLNNAAITRLDFHSDHVRLVYLNRAGFLPRELVT